MERYKVSLKLTTLKMNLFSKTSYV